MKIFAMKVRCDAISYFVMTFCYVGGIEHFIFKASEAASVPTGKLLIIGYIDTIHRMNGLRLEGLFNSQEFLSAVGKLRLLPDVRVFVDTRYVTCQRHYVETAVIDFMANMAGFKNATGHVNARTAVIVHNCDLSCSVFAQVGRFAGNMGVYLTLCNEVMIGELSIFRSIQQSDEQGLGGISKRVIIRQSTDSFKPAIVSLISLLKHGLSFFNLNCVNIVTMPDTITIKDHNSNKTLEELLKSKFICNSSELFDLRNNLYHSRASKSVNYTRGPTFYFILMSELDSIEYHKYVIDDKFVKKKVPLILTYAFNPGNNSTHSAFDKLERGFFFNLQDTSPIYANFNLESNPVNAVLSPIYFYDRVLSAFRDFFSNVYQLVESVVNESLRLNLDETMDTDGYAELWFMWNMTGTPRSYSFGRYYFGNKSTQKNFPDERVNKLFRDADLTNLKAVDDCGMQGTHCKVHDFGLMEKLMLATGPISMLGLLIIGYLLYRFIHYKILQRSVIQWKITVFDEVKKTIDFRKHTSLMINALRKRSSPESTTHAYSADITHMKNKQNSANTSDPNRNVRDVNFQLFPNENWSARTISNMKISRHKNTRTSRDTKELVKKNRLSSGDYNTEGGRRLSLTDKHQGHQNLAVFQEDEVYLNRMSSGKVWENMFCTNILEELVQMKNINHENLLPFLGISMRFSTVLMLAAKRGSLRDIIKDKCLNQVFNLEIMVSVLLDISKGMDYLHNSVIGSHGNLRSSKCVLDNRWNCKITGYGLKSIRKYKTKKQAPVFQNYLYYSPELLRTPINYRSAYGTRKGDVYAFGIILQEVIQMADPYAMEIKNKNMDITHILVLVRSRKQYPPFRPSLGECRKEWKMLAEACWHEIPEYRFSFQQIMTILRKLAGIENLTFVERLAQRLEQNVSNLGNMVSELTADVQKESEKTNAFLSSLLPKIVAQDYILGKQYKPEIFQSVTMLCTDIIGFTKISGISSPRQTVDLLRDLYTGFDTVLAKKDAYKLETIGDAYIVISGCPERNGNKHASEASEVALEIVAWVNNFEIPHLPHSRIEIRAGIHSGPVIAGVVGLKVPRFCVFGKTYSIAELLEGASEKNKILISKVSVDLLPKNQYVLIPRGKIELPDKETLETFFLESKRKLI